ncbi:MAG: 50S ribosomal protein L20 [Candidatus Ryanbacteria bacterium RIFCSPHIGHO2_02_FULL_45_13b]|uniref:Large ribosomal subunit protein bL20 n=1 Tax=Candidatus Ryanbacteria bacterium RIFCSPHIGHO2_02_FULL_45_13b TaxID=1802117 RepID=A0A1G2GAM8_9BACT|nr:MAG: 50S ribosomal protein L20 [Candidatus Ryanbacteria bacterium RIFCSPHIGHO2_02_FULL_45_13b]
MTRVKRGTISVKRRRNVLKQTKGFRWGRKSKERAAREALLHAGVHRFNDNRKKKRVRRTLWSIKINAGARINGITYSKLINVLKTKHIELDRKILATLAEHHPMVFKQIVELATK